MVYRSWLKLAGVVIALALLVAIVEAWREDRRDRSQLAAQLAAAQQSLNEASAHEHDRDTQLSKTLADLAAQKRSVITPTGVLRDLPNVLPLPTPIALQADHTSSQNTTQTPANEDGAQAATHKTARAPSSSDPVAGQGSAAPAAQSDSSSSGPASAASGAVIPREDLKPLYDFAIDCKGCQAKLAAAQSDLSDEKGKTVTLTKERDEAVRVAKGGSPWRRTARAIKWLVIGAAAGVIASKVRH